MIIKIKIDETEKLLMEDMVIDIEQWFLSGPFKEKCDNHRHRIANIVRQRLMAIGEKTIPAQIDDLVNLYFKDPNYKNRKQRDEIEQKKREKLAKEKMKIIKDRALRPAKPLHKPKIGGRIHG